MTKYEQMGRAATLPGLVLAVEILQAAVDEIRASLAEMQNEKPAQPKTRGKMSRAAHSYWAPMTPEERSAEMKRRQKVAKARRKREAQSTDPIAKQPVLENGRLSMAGLKRGTPEFRAVDAYNKRHARPRATQNVNGEAVA